MCTLIYKFFENNVPKYINDIFRENTGKYNARNPNMLKCPYYKTSNGQKAIKYIGPKLWDDMPNHLKGKRSNYFFKHDYQNHYIKNLNL